MKAEAFSKTPIYGATNQAFFDEDGVSASPKNRYTKQQSLIDAIDDVPPPPIAEEKLENLVSDDRPEDERESWDSKITFLLATIG